MYVCISMYVYIDLGKFHHNFTVLPHWNHGLFEGNHSLSWLKFRLVQYVNLPRLMGCFMGNPPLIIGPYGLTWYRYPAPIENKSDD